MSDTCQRPGCGHEHSEHGKVTGSCNHCGNECGCTWFCDHPVKGIDDKPVRLDQRELIRRIYELEAEQDYWWQMSGKGWSQARVNQARFKEARDERDALQVRLDRVTALADEWMNRTAALLDSHKQHAAELLDVLEEDA